MISAEDGPLVSTSVQVGLFLWTGFVVAIVALLAELYSNVDRRDLGKVAVGLALGASTGIASSYLGPSSIHIDMRWVVPCWVLSLFLVGLGHPSKLLPHAIRLVEETRPTSDDDMQSRWLLMIGLAVALYFAGAALFGIL